MPSIFIKKTIYFSMTIIMLMSCRNTSLSLDNQIPLVAKDFVEIKIDPDSAKNGQIISSFLDSISYLPLQTTEQSMFAEISQLEITSKTYVIWDEQSNCILFFLKNGDFLKKISNTDLNLKLPFKKIHRFYVNERKGEVVFSDSYSAYSYVYSLTGEFIRIIDSPPFQGTAYTSIGDMNVYFQGYYNPGAGVPTSNLIFTNNGSITKHYLPFDPSAVEYTDIYSVGKSFYKNQNGIVYFSTAYDYSIYTIDSLANMFKSFTLILPPVKIVPEDFMTNSGYRSKRSKYTNSNRNIIYAITDFYKNKNNVTFSLIGHARNETFIYNIKSQKLVSFRDYISDSISSMLPISSGKIHGIDENGQFISSVTAVSLFQSKLNLGMAGKQDNELPVSLERFYRSNNLQNPVLTLFSAKQ